MRMGWRSLSGHSLFWPMRSVAGDDRLLAIPGLLQPTAGGLKTGLTCRVGGRRQRGPFCPTFQKELFLGSRLSLALAGLLSPLSMLRVLAGGAVLVQSDTSGYTLALEHFS